VFGLRRKSRSQLVRQELVQSAEHFKQAATHAARGTGATVGPRLNAAVDRVQPTADRVKGAATSSWGSTVAVLAPLAAAAADGARQAGKQGRKAKDQSTKKLQKKSNLLQKRTNKALGRKQAKPRASKLAGLLLAGAAVGAGAAYVLKRRQREQWDEYDPSRPIGSADQAAADSLSGALRPSDAAFQVDPASPVFGETVISTPPAVAESGLTVGDEKKDQTSSSQHSPTVARMASGTKDS
jgi:hypothetical protein